MAERVRELVRPVRRVHVDEDRSDPGARELQQRPLGAGGGPDADAVTDLDADGEQPACDALDLGAELAIGEANALVSRHQRFHVGLRDDHLLQGDADRVTDERRCRGPGVVRRSQLSHRVPP